MTLTLPGFIFFTHFSSDPDEELVMEQFKLNTLRLLLSKIYWKKGNNCCFTDHVKKNFDVGMYLDV